jgi:tetratricopeptide (TPR) repeat protein
MNTAFTGARSPKQLMTAYYAASRVVAYIVERFGMPRVVSMLRAWGEGKPTGEVFEQSLGISLSRLDRDFRKHTAQRLSARADDFSVDPARYTNLPALRKAAEQNPDDADALAALALGHLFRGKADRAEKPAGEALALAPNHALGNYAMTRVALEKSDIKRASRHLRAIVKGGSDGYIIRLMLARASIARAAWKRALKHLEAAVAIDPERAEAWQAMVEVARAQFDEKLLLRALTALVEIDQHDRMAHASLLASLFAKKRWADLVRYGERTLYVDPGNPEVHRLLGRAYLERNRARDSLRELKQAVALGHPDAGRIHLERARAFLALGKRKSARQEAARAVLIAPDLAKNAKRLLKTNKN